METELEQLQRAQKALDRIDDSLEQDEYYGVEDDLATLYEYLNYRLVELTDKKVEK